MIAILLILLATLSFGHGTPKVLTDVKFEQKIGSPLDSTITLKDENGMLRQVANLKNKHPSIFVFSYGDCKTLCSMVMNSLIKGVNGMPPGIDFNVFVLSIDPKESAQDMRSKKSVLDKRLLNKNSMWSFFTSNEANIQRAASELGFHFRYDEKSKQYAHAAGIIFLTPDNRVSSYILGLEYTPENLKSALKVAASGAKGNFVEELLLYCFHYDPEMSPYGIVIVNSLRIGGVLTLVALALLLLGQKRRRA